MGIFEWPARASLRVGLDVVLFAVAILGGRVIPMFTNNGVPGAGARRIDLLERVAVGSLLALLVADVAGLASVAAFVACVGAIVHAWRLALWHPLKTLRAPLVWILHASYAWIPIHLGLRALAVAGFVPDALATHALTIGVIGGMTLGMMTRTARGHSGQPLVAGRAEVACYALVLAGAAIRVFGAWLVPAWYFGTVIASAACWSLAFATYAVSYASMLIGRR
jgi:uncharacterized protein involved in response to NO